MDLVHKIASALLVVSATAVTGSGILAAFWPRAFKKLAKVLGQPIDSQRWLAWLDTWKSIDHLVLCRTRTFGVVLIVTAGYLWFRFGQGW